MNYADIRPIDVANGPGVRVSLFVSGCTHACPGCFNPEAWDFGYGQPFTQTEAEQVLNALAKPYVKGFSLLGGGKGQKAPKPKKEKKEKAAAPVQNFGFAVPGAPASAPAAPPAGPRFFDDLSKRPSRMAGPLAHLSISLQPYVSGAHTLPSIVLS